MTLEVIPPQLGHGGAHLNDKLYPIVKEIQGWSLSVVTGAAANTNIPVTGILLEDTIIKVVLVDFVGATVTEVAATITSNGNIQTTATSAAKALLVYWYNKK